jgi:disulfide bond formation protein DsbB
MPSRRVLNATGFIVCAVLLGYAYFAQFQLTLDPCPLCIFQRIAMLALAMVFLAAALHNPGAMGARIYGVLILVAAGIGSAVAGRHVWLQHLPPDKVPECGPGLEYMLEAFPIGEALKLAFTGSGECATVDWTFLGLSMPAWVLVCFVGLGMAGLVRNWMRDT